MSDVITLYFCRIDEYKLVLVCRFFICSPFYFSIKQIFVQHLLWLIFKTASFISRLPVLSCLSGLPSPSRWIPLLTFNYIPMHVMTFYQAQQNVSCIIGEATWLYEFCFVVVTNYNKFSELKQHTFYILQFWRSEVKNESH